MWFWMYYCYGDVVCFDGNGDGVFCEFFFGVFIKVSVFVDLFKLVVGG